MPPPPTTSRASSGSPSELDADLVVIGPEGPLVAGLADALRARGRRAFGPGRDGARLEGSKAFAKDLMDRHGDPDGSGRDLRSRRRERDRRDVLAFVDELGGRAVVKADGLAAGKGVTVASDRGRAIAAIEESLVDGCVRSSRDPGGRGGGARGRRGVGVRLGGSPRRSCPSHWRRTSSGPATATPGRTPGGWARTRRSRGSTTAPRPELARSSRRPWTRCVPTGSPTGPPLRRPDAHAGRPEGP